ncbi:MAG: hypothetical protein HQK78_00365 [Desulfobacterales bacterium]|nr:hypothetical protein [Desulfobacterales bacterium]
MQEALLQEMLMTYKEIYNQLVSLKHIVYSSIILSDPTSVATIFSKQLKEKLNVIRNSIWLVEKKRKVKEIVCDGEIVEGKNARIIDIESSEICKKLVKEQLMVWNSSFPEQKDLFPDFKQPIFLPIKTKIATIGFLVLERDEASDTEIYQFFAHFASMIFEIALLHQKVEEQQKEVSEINQILTMQNEQLSTLYHVGLKIIGMINISQVLDIMATTSVTDLKAQKAFVFILDKKTNMLLGVSSEGFKGTIASIIIDPYSVPAIKHSLESGRISNYSDYNSPIELGEYLSQNYVIFPIRGKDMVHGFLIIEIEQEDIIDSISILVNYISMILDKLIIQKDQCDG